MKKQDYLDKTEIIVRGRRQLLPDASMDNNILIEKQILRQLKIPLMYGFLSEDLYD